MGCFSGSGGPGRADAHGAPGTQFIGQDPPGPLEVTTDALQAARCLRARAQVLCRFTPRATAVCVRDRRALASRIPRPLRSCVGQIAPAHRRELPALNDAACASRRSSTRLQISSSGQVVVIAGGAICMAADVMISCRDVVHFVDLRGPRLQGFLFSRFAPYAGTANCLRETSSSWPDPRPPAVRRRSRRSRVTRGCAHRAWRHPTDR